MAKERRNAGEAYKLGQEGGNAPDWVLNDPSGHFLRQFELGQSNSAAPPTPAGPPSSPEGAPPGRGRPPRPARGAPPKPKSARPAAGRGGRSAGALNTPLPAPIRRAVPVPNGDVGGLLLALVLYPLGLAIVRFGARGPGIWLRAKFLNQTTPSPATGGGGGGLQRPSRT